MSGPSNYNQIQQPPSNVSTSMSDYGTNNNNRPNMLATPTTSSQQAPKSASTINGGGGKRDIVEAGVVANSSSSSSTTSSSSHNNHHLHLAIGGNGGGDQSTTSKRRYGDPTVELDAANRDAAMASLNLNNNGPWMVKNDDSEELDLIMIDPSMFTAANHHSIGSTERRPFDPLE